MSFTDLGAHRRAVSRSALAGLLLSLAACSSGPPVPWIGRPQPAVPGMTEPIPTTPLKPEHGRLPPPVAARDWPEFKLQAARRMVAADPEGSYTGDVAEPLLAIPVLEVELHADGSIRRIEVLRVPKAGHTETVQMAIEAVRRAAPFGDVSRLPKPWRFTEAFLYDDAKRFKPRTLDE